MKEKPARAARISGEERRSQIIDAALELFARKGFSGSRTREIAASAGISETLIFRHFKTKKSLYHAALKELIGRHPAIPEVAKPAAERDDFGVFKAVAEHVAQQGRQDRQMVRFLLFSALEDLRLRDSIEAGPSLADFLGDYIRQRVEEGAFRKVNSPAAARLFIGAMLMFVVDREAALTGPVIPCDDDEAVETLVTIFLEGLRIK